MATAAHIPCDHVNDFFGYQNSVFGSHTTVPRKHYAVLLAVCHWRSILGECFLHVWKMRHDFLFGSNLRYSNGKLCLPAWYSTSMDDKLTSTLCLYTVTGWGVMSWPF